jgi:hypothetical protein
MQTPKKILDLTTMPFDGIRNAHLEQVAAELYSDQMPYHIDVIFMVTRIMKKEREINYFAVNRNAFLKATFHQ